MTNRERLEAVFSGKTPDRVPFTPFAELVPRAQFECALRARGMGFVQHYSSVQEGSASSVAIEMSENGGKRVLTTTTEGVLTEFFHFQKGASNDGFVQSKYMIDTDADYAPTLAHLNGLHFSMDDSDYALQDAYLGDEGLLHAWSFEPPYMGAQYYLGYERWVYEQLDAPERFAALLEALSGVQTRRMAQVLRAPERLVNIGNLAGNFSPADFARHMLPYLHTHATALRAAGKWPTLHADASNLREFSKLIPQTGIRVIEAFTPPPIGDLSLADARRDWGEETTIWINFPESVLQEGYEQTRAYTRELLRSDPCPNKLIGFTEMGFVGASAESAACYAEGLNAILDAIASDGIYK